MIPTLTPKEQYLPIAKDDIDRVNLLIDYILQFEEDDFQINPSMDHIYFHAYALRNGTDQAVIDFVRAKQENEE